MSIKNRNQILNDLLRDGKKNPNGWNAVFGKDSTHLSKDYYIFHPKVGIYLLKEYNKNPFQIKGVGGKVARKIDQDIESIMKKNNGDFGIIQGNYQKILQNLKKGIKPEKIYESAIKGNKDFGLSIPIRGKASSSKKIFNNLKENPSNKQKKINEKFKKIAYDDGFYSGYD